MTDLRTSSPGPAPSARALNCPSCGGTISLKAAGYSVTLVCLYCASVLDVSRPEVRLIQEFHEAAAELEIPLGTRGTLDGVEWEVIGYLRRSEGGQYPWEEYLLFNPYHGYRWLISNGRGWSFGEQLTRAPDWQNEAISLDGKPYAPFFADGRAQVDYVLGEFYWRVRAGEEVATDDYVRPGWMLSREANDQEISWSLSRWLAPAEISKAFGVDAPGRPWPPLPHQPSPHVKALKSGWKVALIAFLFLLGVTLFFGGGKTLATGTFRVAQDSQERSATLGPIRLTRPYQIVRIKASAPALNQGWVDLNLALVDRATQVSWQAYAAAERYSGRDSEGDWSEGSRRATVRLAAVPAGTYDLVVDYGGHRWNSGPADAFGATSAADPQDLVIEVAEQRIFFSNFLIALLLILLPLIVILIRHLSFEQARQAESDFAPTLSDDEEEDD